MALGKPSNGLDSSCPDIPVRARQFRAGSSSHWPIKDLLAPEAASKK